MLDIILKILSLLGIIILVLLAVLLAALLLVLFLPVFYKVSARKMAEDTQVSVKANWLFGLLRIRYHYPNPGTIVVKLLWITIFDSGRQKNEESSKDASQNGEKSPKALKTKEATDKAASDKKQNEPEIKEEVSETGTEEALWESEATLEEKNTIIKRILAKYEKLKYTIRKIYDKIKHIVENIAFYAKLIQDEETLELFRHACFRLGRILKSIRPRRLKGEILFGTGSPDTTGYVLGVYGMLSPWMGKHMNITPDFTRSILEGKLYAAGHITVFILLVHSLRLLMDKRLRLLKHRMKTHTI